MVLTNKWNVSSHTLIVNWTQISSNIMAIVYCKPYAIMISHIYGWKKTISMCFKVWLTLKIEPKPKLKISLHIFIRLCFTRIIKNCSKKFAAHIHIISAVLLGALNAT